MTATQYSEYKQVTETYESTSANNLIRQGWELINVLQRSSIHEEGGAIVVYVLGLKEVIKPVEPIRDYDINQGEDW